MTSSQPKVAFLNCLVDYGIKFFVILSIKNQSACIFDEFNHNFLLFLIKELKFLYLYKAQYITDIRRNQLIAILNDQTDDIKEFSLFFMHVCLDWRFIFRMEILSSLVNVIKHLIVCLPLSLITVISLCLLLLNFSSYHQLILCIFTLLLIILLIFIPDNIKFIMNHNRFVQTISFQYPCQCIILNFDEFVMFNIGFENCI